MLRHRAMEPDDIPECVDIVAAHPLNGPRYGPLIKHLPEAWLRLLQSESGAPVVIHREARSPILMVAVSAFVNDDFMVEIKAPPHFWLGPELVRRITRGKSPLLTGKQLREANSGGGLNLLVWEGCPRAEHLLDGELLRYLMIAFVQEHRGFRWKEIASQSSTPEHLAFSLNTGGLLWDPTAGGYISVTSQAPEDIVARPHLVGVTREIEQNRQSRWTGNWVGTLFDYQAPVFGLSPNEQGLLSSALSGATDEQLAGSLAVSLSAVKKVWASIYRRVEACVPEPGRGAPRLQGPASSRGREKRRSLLNYLREHPEELRPGSLRSRCL